MASDSGKRSPSFTDREATTRKDVGMLGEQRLESWFAPTKGIETDALVVEIDLCADQSMRPVLAHGEAMAEDGCVTVIIGTPDENDRAAGRRLKIEREVLRHGCTRWSAFDSHDSTASRCSDVALGVI